MPSLRVCLSRNYWRRTKQSLPDGSSIDGETTFTRSDGTTGTAATVSFATSGDYVVQQSVTQNADGSTVLQNSAFTPDGQLADQITTTTSANGLDRTITYDWNGDGIVDRIETDGTVVNTDGSTTETVTDTNAAGVVPDSTTTTTSANGQVVTIDRDTTGAGYTDQQEVDTRSSSGGSSVSVSDLTRDGTRTETVTDCNADGSMRDQTVAITSADGLTTTTSVDGAGGPLPRRSVPGGTTRGSGGRNRCPASIRPGGGARESHHSSYDAERGLPAAGISHARGRCRQRPAGAFAVRAPDEPSVSLPTTSQERMVPPKEARACP